MNKVRRKREGLILNFCNVDILTTIEGIFVKEK